MNTNFYNFTANMTPMMAGKAETTLSQLSRYEGVVRTSADFVAYLIQNGGRPEIREGITSFYGSKWDLKENKPKTEYCIFLDEKIFVTIKKTEYDFALYLQANGGDTVDGAQLLCQAESKRIADRAALEEARQKEQAEKEAKEKADQEAFTEWLDTTAETYMQNRDSRIPVMQDIFKKSLKDIADFTVSRQQVKLLVLIDNINDFRCKERLKSFLYLHNSASRKTFEMLTGIKLSKTLKGTYDLVDRAFRDGNEFAVKAV
jgi:hypothetical protein